MSEFVLNINVSLYDRNGPGGRLEVREETVIGPMTFLQIAGILGRFHELAEEIKAGAP